MNQLDTAITEEVTIEKLVHGGQGLATLADGRKLFVWGVLPGERVTARIIKRKRSYVEAIAVTIVQASPERLEPREENYLATSPWQIIGLEAEDRFKKQIIQELFRQAHVALPDFTVAPQSAEWQYRNKMEYSFWGDDAGLHLALHRRGSHNKQIVTGSALALPAIDQAANAILRQLQTLEIRAGDLKTVIVRCSQAGEAVAALFVKAVEFPALQLADGLKGLRVYYSNPKSPASVGTELLQDLGDSTLHDSLLGRQFIYDVDSFFQVNIPIFEQALQTIKSHGQADSLVDMYAGAGSIGLSVASQSVDLVEIDPPTAAMARLNAAQASVDARIIEAPSEKALDYIVSDKTVIFDPPRAGLHDRVVERVLAVKPPKIIYLSCNPATQARDLARWVATGDTAAPDTGDSPATEASDGQSSASYKITHFSAYNFFPHTPHIETLAVLEAA